MSETFKVQYKMPYTLEMHFKNLATISPNALELHSLWILLKKRIEEQLSYSKGVFGNFSLHDGSHSRSIIQSIERFLDEDRIKMLSATDTFMLLACAYTHDYGMAQTYTRIYDILGSEEFKEFLKNTEEKISFLEKEDAWAVINLLTYLSENKTNTKKLSLQDIYYSIILVLQLYIRPLHWKFVLDIESDLRELFQGHLKGRFIRGCEGIIELCMCHGQKWEELFKLSYRADGMTGDDYHPRFVATMLRLGDLLDLDNGRFPVWFVREINKGRNIIPELSIMNYRKHEAISHLLITSQKIEITAQCDSKQNGYQVAELVSDWTNWLEDECRQMLLHWDDIAQPNFGRPPGKLSIRILVDGLPYTAVDKKLRMQMSQERVMKLLEGTSIYRDQYVGIREIIQNAIDASLLQLWKDITHHRYLSYKLTKDVIYDGLDLLKFTEKDRNKIFGKYDIIVEVIKSKKDQKVYLTVKDKGIGITPEDMEFIANMGSSKENNVRIKTLMRGMPKWMKPAGIFGIGLQSVFQLTDCIVFYTRQHNTPERQILLYSYGKNRGKIEIRDVLPNEEGLYHDNAIPGTNVQIAIEPKKLLGNGKRDHFLYYDKEFDTDEELDVIYAELCHVVVDKIRECRCDYFNVFFESIEIDEHGIVEQRSERKRLRTSFFASDLKIDKFEAKKIPFGFFHPFLTTKKEFSFVEESAYYWDSNDSRCYRLTICPCIIEDMTEHQHIYLPDSLADPYRISYKFNILLHSNLMDETPLSIANAGLLKCDLLILDDDTTKYLNINREYLKEQALDLKELLKVQQKILNQWCIHLTQKGSNHVLNLAKTKPGLLPSLILLFYVNVPKNTFQSFIKPYLSLISEKKWMIQNLAFEDIWNDSKVFHLESPIDMAITNTPFERNDVESIPLSEKIFKNFPKYLINIDSIYTNVTGNSLIYYFNFQKFTEEKLIYMSDRARFYDYLNAFEPYENQPHRVDFATVQKKVFKANTKFPNLSMSYYPHTYMRGNNFSSFFDSCICNYILSPFDKDATNLLKRSIEKNENRQKDFRDHVMTSRHLEKCISYITKAKNVKDEDVNKIQSKLKQEYETFVCDFYKLLYQNRTLVTKRFE